MFLASKKARVSVLVLGLVFLAALCCLVILMGRDQPAALAATGSTTAASRITNIDLNASISPTPISAGQQPKLTLSVSTVGGPGPVTIMATVPKRDGSGNQTGRATVMFDRNATYGFSGMPIDMPTVPGRYSFTFRAEVGTGSTR